MALLSEYGFTEGSGTTAADTSGNGRTLTASGTAWTATGKNGAGAVPSFSGVLGPNASFDNWTVMCWVKRTGTIPTQWGQVLANGGTFWLEVTASDNTLGYNSPSGPLAGPALTLDTWYHVAVTGAAGVGTTLFIDGTQYASTGTVSSWNFGSGTWTVATGPDGDLVGVVDELRVYDTALDATAITTAMNTAVSGTVSATIVAPAASLTAGVTAPSVVGTEPQPADIAAPAANVTLAATAPSATGTAAFTYISGTHASGRYFVDQNGAPILVRGDSPWSMFTDLSTAQVETWAANRETNGFNAAIISLIGSTANGGPSNDGATYDGILPFASGDITNPNETYWARVDTMMASLRDHGITAFLYPMDGWNTATGCVFAGKSNADCQTYGTFVANRYAAYPNIVWMVGGDYFPVTNEPADGSPIDHRFDSMLTGIRSTGDTRLFSIQLGYDKSISTDNPFWAPKVNYNFVYTYYPTYRAVLQAYARDATLPALFSEGNYEGENNNTVDYTTTDETLRRQACWSLTSGSPGDFYGHNDWEFNTGWETRLDTNAVTDLKRIRDKFASLEWWKLVPDTGSTWLTGGRGTQVTDDTALDVLQSDYATAAVASDDSFAVAYVPSSRSITINTSRIPNATAYWFNPDTGAVTAQSLSSGTFVSPTGDNLLFVESQPAPDYKYITSVSSNGRYFLDQYGAPILIKGWSPWSALSDLSSSEMDTWCQGAEDAGVNAAIMSLIGSVDNGGPYDTGATYDGVLPFNGGDITSWNETYWARMDSYLAKCRDHGITVFLYPIDGWNLSKVFSGKSLADCQTYGTMVANRFASLPNIMWMSGGDYSPITNEKWLGATTDHQIDAMLTGIRSTGDTRPFSVQLNYNRSFSTDNQYWEARVDWTFCYTYFPPYECVWDSYDRIANANEAAGERDPRPSLFCEGVYEGGGQGWNTANDEVLRRQVGWSITAGSPGDFYGSMDWHFNTAGWETRMNTAAIQQRKKLQTWFGNLPGWYLLVPDEDRTAIVSAGRGTKLSNLSENANIDVLANDYVTAAQTPDRSLTLVYVPTNVSDNNARTITLNSAMLPANYTAVWVDPTDATVTQAAAINGSYEVTTPGLHYDNSRDWLLLIQGDPSNYPFVGGISANGRYFIDQNSSPLLINTEIAWFIASQLTVSEQHTYFADRQSKGFNAVTVAWIAVGVNGANAQNYLTYDGVSPFIGNDISTINTPYWDRLSAFIDLAASYGMTLFLNVMSHPDIDGSPYSATTSQCQTYGANLASYYKDKPNIVWFVGVDYPSTQWAQYDAKFDAIRTGLRSGGDTHLFSVQYHNNNSITADNTFWTGKYDYEEAYSYRATYEVMYKAYNSGSGKPALLCESNFEDENNEAGPTTTNETMRRQVCWSLTCGGAGVTYGRKSIWRLDADWQTALTSTFVIQNQRLFDRFNSLAWHTLVPDQTDSLITAGAGTKPTSGTQNGGYVDPLESSYATGAVAANGALAVIYVPTSRTMTVDTTKIVGLTASYWVDPTNATLTTTATFSGNDVTTPGTNAAGQQDWLLVMEGTGTPVDSSGKVILSGQAYPVFMHDGSAWVERQVYYHDGTSWVLSK